MNQSSSKMIGHLKDIIRGLENGTIHSAAIVSIADNVVYVQWTSNNHLALIGATEHMKSLIVMDLQKQNQAPTIEFQPMAIN